MAKITIKRNTGGAYENLYPRTTVEQLFDTDGTTTLFDGNKQLKTNYLPSSIIGGLKFAGTILAGSPSSPIRIDTLITGTVTTGYTVSAQLDTISGITHPNYTATSNQYIGYYWIISNNLTVDNQASTTPADWRAGVLDDGIAPADAGGGIQVQGLTLEAGDWLIITGYDNTNKTFIFNVINNTYASATTAITGVVQLSGDTLTSQLSGNNVITEGVLAGLLTTGNLSGLTGDALLKIPTANHTHSQYQAADGDLTALSALSGTGFVKRTGTDTYTLDTNTYLTSQSNDFGTVSVSDTDSGHTWAATGSAAADATGDTLTLVSGTDIDIDVSSTTDAIRVSHADTSALSGAYGSAGIASITVDGEGHVTAITSATYNNYSLPLAADGTRGGIQIGATQTETNRAVILTSEKASVTLPRQIPAVTFNGSSSTAPSFFAPSGAGLTGSTTQTKQRLNAVTGSEPTWIDSPNIYYDTTTGATLGDIILDVE